jgi:uridylate kinase
MCKQNVVLLKLSGDFLRDNGHTAANANYVRELARQVRALQSTHYFGIVVDGNGFFKGTQETLGLNITFTTSAQVGILATLIRGSILQDLFAQEGVEAELFSAIECPSIASSFSPQNLRMALRIRDCVIFAGGAGNSLMATDTTALVRALQMQAHEVWKVTYTQAIDKQFDVLDQSALALAREHGIAIRLFSLFTPQALIRAAHDSTFGSRLSPSL